jgi:hypothetical protein
VLASLPGVVPRVCALLQMASLELDGKQLDNGLTVGSLRIGEDSGGTASVLPFSMQCFVLALFRHLFHQDMKHQVPANCLERDWKSRSSTRGACTTWNGTWTSRSAKLQRNWVACGP